MADLRFLKLDDEGREAGTIQLADDARFALLANCLISQQQAGFKDVADLRQLHCPDCGAAGFNTGWGNWQFTCGASWLTDGEACDQSCPKSKRADKCPAHD